MSKVYTISEFTKSLGEAIEKFPYELEVCLENVGKAMRKEFRQASPTSSKTHKRKLKNSFKFEIVGYKAADFELRARSTAPHFHLIERGHYLYKKKKDKASGKTTESKTFVPGTLFYKGVENITQSEHLPKQAAKAIKKIKKIIEEGK